MRYLVFATFYGRKMQVGRPCRSHATAEVGLTQLREAGLHAWIEVRTRQQVGE